MATVPTPGEILELDFMRTALAELVLLALAGGLLGAFVVLRGLAFFGHAVGAAAFPGLVVADAAGIAPQAGAAAAAAAYTGGVGRAGRTAGDAATGLLLVAALALGAVLASDVFDSGAGVDGLLFGTLVGLDSADVALSALAALVATLAAAGLGRAWLALAFDPDSSRALGLPHAAVDTLLLAAVAVAVVAALPAAGALLATVLLVVPAATARLVARTPAALVGGAVAIALADGILGLYLAYWADAPPGPAVAVLAAGVYACVAIASAAARRRA